MTKKQQLIVSRKKKTLLEEKDPAKVAAAYKGLMVKTVTSPRWKLTPQDWQKFGRDVFIFSIPALLVVLQVMQQGGTTEEMIAAVKVWLISQAVNLLQKWAGEKTYIE